MYRASQQTERLPDGKWELGIPPAPSTCSPAPSAQLGLALGCLQLNKPAHHTLWWPGIFLYRRSHSQGKHKNTPPPTLCPGSPVSSPPLCWVTGLRDARLVLILPWGAPMSSLPCGGHNYKSNQGSSSPQVFPEQVQTTTWGPVSLIVSLTDSQTPPSPCRTPFPYLADQYKSSWTILSVGHNRGTAPMPSGPDQQPLLPCPHKSPVQGFQKLQAVITPQLLVSGLKTFNLKFAESILIRARFVCLMPAQ